MRVAMLWLCGFSDRPQPRARLCESSSHVLAICRRPRTAGRAGRARHCRGGANVALPS